MHVLKQRANGHRQAWPTALHALRGQPGLFAAVQPAKFPGVSLSPFHERFACELSWLGGLPAVTPPAARILAARVAASQAGQLSPADQPSLAEQHAYEILLAERPEPQAAARAVASLDGKSADTLSEQDIACLRLVWGVSLAVEALLASGGDERLTIDPKTGLNRYGCAPWPRPHVIGFASCTASSLSEGAFVAAEQARRALIESALSRGSDAAVSATSETVADAILTYFEAGDLADAVLAASGTDAALIVTGLLAAERPDVAMTSILVSPAETGSGVPDAVQGRHFAGCAPSGRPVDKGRVLEGLHQSLRLVTIALRDESGAPLSPDFVAGACETAVRAALPHGRVVLHAIDGSKTGLAAPDRPTLMRLARQFDGVLDIVIDACQARIEPAMVRWYLQQGFPVLVTGSKFFAAPGFCGAVLFPRARLARIAGAGLIPGGLAPYADLEHGFGSRRCAGLLLRWSAALFDMACFGALAAEEVGARLDRFGADARAMLRRDERLHLIAAPRPAGMGWSDRRSVFTFAVRDGDGWADMSRLRRLYLALQAESPEASGPVHATATLPCQLGQPVQLGSAALGGLRIAVSAAQLTESGDQSAALGCVFDRLQLMLDAARAASRDPVVQPALVTG